MTTIVLAAGLSERMGQNKLLLPFKNEAIINHTVRKALSFSHRVIVVVGNERDKIEESLSIFPVDFVFNSEYRKGQRTSVLAGVKAVVNDDFAVLPGDLPLLGEEDAAEAVNALNKSSIVRCSFKNIPGHPVVYRKENRERLLTYPGSMKEYLKETGFISLSSSLGVIYDIDTPPKYQALLESNGDLSILESSCNVTIS